MIDPSLSPQRASPTMLWWAVWFPQMIEVNEACRTKNRRLL
jgi:hypothetical protein